MSLSVTFDDRAAKDLIGLPVRDMERARQRIRAYAAEPSAPQHDCIPMRGSHGVFRLRSGDWRIIFSVEGDVMRVLRISHRREAYR